MPLAGRLTDLWGARRPFLGALAIFMVGLGAGRASRRRWTSSSRRGSSRRSAAACSCRSARPRRRTCSSGPARPRALGVIGALTFLGMAAGPVPRRRDPGVGPPGGRPRRRRPRQRHGPTFLAPAWRWIFFVNVPIGIVALLLGWAASTGWDTPRRPGRIDLVGAAWFGLALLSGLVGLTLVGSTEIAGGGRWTRRR